MKKTVAVGNIIFIYMTAALPILLFTADKNKLVSFLWEHLFFNNIFIPVGSLILFGIAMYIANIIFLIKARCGVWDARELARTNMNVKLIQIPAYLLIFIMGLICALMIFTIGISFVFMLLDAFSLGMTGLFASAVFLNMKKEQKITGKIQVFLTLASFLFCADVAAAVIGYKLSRPNSLHAD